MTGQCTCNPIPGFDDAVCDKGKYLGLFVTHFDSVGQIEEFGDSRAQFHRAA